MIKNSLCQQPFGTWHLQHRIHTDEAHCTGCADTYPMDRELKQLRMWGTWMFFIKTAEASVQNITSEGMCAQHWEVNEVMGNATPFTSSTTLHNTKPLCSLTACQDDGLSNVAGLRWPRTTVVGHPYTGCLWKFLCPLLHQQYGQSLRSRAEFRGAQLRLW